MAQARCLTFLSFYFLFSIIRIGSGFECMPIMKNKYLLIDLTPASSKHSFSYSQSAFTSMASLNYSNYTGSTIDLNDIQITRF